jgi:hypothetical protein
VFEGPASTNGLKVAILTKRSNTQRTETQLALVEKAFSAVELAATSNQSGCSEECRRGIRDNPERMRWQNVTVP